ncbi:MULTISPECIES: hypothetical protein [Streptomyces]|uniref:Uncharacterized protein n=1 Tax=Streptomyces sp. 900129855 TaxID=3155129 RepID=A0ABV2ZT34_9ACTN
MVEVVLAGVLGAAVLAIVLLYKNGQSQTARLTKLEAELVAERIARITQQPVPLPVLTEDEDPEPVRRKRHLALYIGGGVAAFISSLGPRLHALVRGRRAAAVTVAASSVLVATTAFGHYANTGSDAAPGSPGHAPVATNPAFSDGDDQAPVPGATDEAGADKNGTTQREGATGSGAAPELLGQSGITGDEHTGASRPEAGSQGGHNDQERPGNDASGTPTPTAPAETQPPVERPTPPSTAEPEPSQPPATEPPADDKPGDDGLCIGVPPIVELCLPGKAQ